MAEGSQRDLVLAPNEFAYILDETKGFINVYVGPNKTSLANTDKPVVFNSTEKKFIRVALEGSIQNFVTAPEGWYVMLKNPSEKQPDSGKSSNSVELKTGHKINMAGPTSFALWPGQMATVIKGHSLRSNQYLVIRVYDVESCITNIGAIGVKDLKAEDIIIGKQFIINGTDVSFYIPPSGIEVVKDKDNKYVMDAVTLERLEYCILLDEDGNKSYTPGPAVVFPKPTQMFVEKDGKRKFKAIELNEISGLYLKVIADYNENGKNYKVGDELFLTGKDCMIYFPRPEHAIIKYGDQEIHYATVIPEGEARYVLDRLNGSIRLQKGPKAFLPDPRTEVIVRRILTDKETSLWFPGNKEAEQINALLAKTVEDVKDTASIHAMMNSSGGYISSSLSNSGAQGTVGVKRVITTKEIADKVGSPMVADSMERKMSYTPPRSIILNTKYEGAVSINIWTGYTVLITSKTGARRVVVGPETVLLNYDESLEVMELSTGKPKTTDSILKTVYLRVRNNRISDIVDVETKDLCNVQMKLTYRANFEGEPNNWFNVENYVKYLCDHMRSVLRNSAKKYGIEEFYSKAIDIVRDNVLGIDTEGKHPGRLFEDNGMRVYDVEVLDVRIADNEIGNRLIQAQKRIVEETIRVTEERRKFETNKIIQDLVRKTNSENTKTKLDNILLTISELDKQAEMVASQNSITDFTYNSDMERKKKTLEYTVDEMVKKLEINIKDRESTTKEVTARLEVFGPALVEAINTLGDKELAAKVAEKMAPLAMLGGESVAEVFHNLIKGTILEGSVIAKKAVSGSSSTSK